jgi:tetratricopeptide (TPR) repeat protein
MFAGLGGSDGVSGVLIRIAANGNDVQAGMFQHRFDVGVSLDLAAVFRAQFGVIEFARGKDRGDLSVRAGVDGGDVRAGDPAVADDADVVFFHKILSGLEGRVIRVPMIFRNGTCFDCDCQNFLVTRLIASRVAIRLTLGRKLVLRCYDMKNLFASLVRCALLLALAIRGFAAPVVPQSHSFVAEAEQKYRAAATRFRAEPGNVPAVIDFARASFDRAEFAANDDQRADLAQAAIDACHRALNENPNDAALHYYLGMNLGQLARTKGIGALKLVRQMEAEFIKARELNSELDYGGPDRNLGMLYLSAPGWPTSIGNHSKAREHLMRAVQIAPDYPENRLDLVDSFLKLRDDAGAQREAQVIAALWPQARQKFSGPEWASSWADWEARWRKDQEKLGEHSRPESPHQRK